MRRGSALLLLVGLWACSNLTDAGSGVVALEVRVPDSAKVEAGDTLQLGVVALDQHGNSVDAPIGWATPDTTITVDSATGRVVGLVPGTGRVQAFSGTLRSDLVSLTVLPRADTLIVVEPSQQTLAPGTTVSQPMVVRAESNQPAGPVSGIRIIYTLVPFGATIPAVQLANEALTDTVVTGADGTPSTPETLALIGTPPSDSVAVEVSSTRRNGTPVPGSGQRFIIRF